MTLRLLLCLLPLLAACTAARENAFPAPLTASALFRVHSDTAAWPGYADDDTTPYVQVALTCLEPTGGSVAMRRLRTALRDSFFRVPVWGDGEDTRPFADHAPAALADMRERIIVEYRAATAELDAELPAHIRRWHYEQVQQEAARSRGTLTVGLSYYTYTGGAHGIYGTGYTAFDEETGDPIGLPDLFLPGSEATLSRLLSDSYRHANELADTQPLTETLDVATIPVTDNFALSDAGFTCHYNPYAIACYAVGAIEVTVPWPLLQDCLRPDGIGSRFIPPAIR